MFNQGASGLIIVLLITSKNKNIPFHVEINPPNGGLDVRSFIKCEDVRSISVERLINKLGVVTHEIMVKVEEILKILIGLSS